MATFVLVHGAWHGGWCWSGTLDLLREHGHVAIAPTLTGLGERSHLLSADITADTHVQDIVNVLEWRELNDVILVGHSYGGLIITGVAGQVPDRIRALVYLDAFVPEISGEAILANTSPDRMAAFQRQIDDGAIGLEPDAAVETWIGDRDVRAWLRTKITPQPKGTFTGGVTLTGREAQVAHRHYIVAALNEHSPFQGEYRRLRGRDSWTTEEIPTWHDAMVEAPEDLAARLENYAGALERGST